MLRTPNQFISENKIKHFISDNDGAFAVDEITWGKHMFNIEGDHSDLIGLNRHYSCEKLYRFTIDNLKYLENSESEYNI